MLPFSGSNSRCEYKAGQQKLADGALANTKRKRPNSLQKLRVQAKLFAEAMERSQDRFRKRNAILEGILSFPPLDFTRNIDAVGTLGFRGLSSSRMI